MKVTLKSNKGVHRVYVDGVLRLETNSFLGALEFVATIREEQTK